MEQGHNVKVFTNRDGTPWSQAQIELVESIRRMHRIYHEEGVSPQARNRYFGPEVEYDENGEIKG